MRPRFRATTALVSLCALCCSFLPAAASESPIRPPLLRQGERIPDRYIVLFKESPSVNTADVLRTHGMMGKARLFPRIHGFASTLNATQVAQLKADSRVALVEPDYTVQIALTFPSFPFPFPVRSSSSSSRSSSRSSSSSSRSSSSSSRSSSSSSSSRSSSVSSSSSSSSSAAIASSSSSAPESSSSSSSSADASSSSSEESSSSIPSSSSSSEASSVSSSSSSVTPSSSSSSSSIASSSSSSSSFSSSSVSTQVIPSGVRRVGGLLSPVSKIDGSDERVDVDIAIIDTGVQKTHPDLNVVAQVNESTDLSPDDQNGHGTHVAGTAAAKDNGIGVVGIAPGARIWSVKVLDSQGSGSMSDVIAGIDYVTQHASEIEVANMSLGCTCQSQALADAITRSVAAGVVYVVAAGNSNTNASTFVPANHPDVLTVSAISDYNGLPGGGAPSTCYSGTDDTLAKYSNYGSVVEITAPGTCIYSSWKGSTYNTISGTSMATPHVTGAVALYLATHPKPTNAQEVAAVRQAIISAAWPYSSGNGWTGDKDNAHEPLLDVEGL